MCKANTENTLSPTKPEALGGFHPAMRFMAVTLDDMAPTLQPGRDKMIVEPCVSFEGPGIYILEDGGKTEIVRAERHDAGRVPSIRLTRDNPEASPAFVLIVASWFDETVIGRVRGTVRTL